MVKQSLKKLSIQPPFRKLTPHSPFTSNLWSIIVPAFNQAPWLSQRLESIRVNVRPGDQIILLDDASSDQSFTLLSEFAAGFHRNQDIRIIRNELNSGNPFTQWNKGLLWANRPWIWIAEGDDWAAPGFREAFEPFCTDPETAVVFCESLVADDKGNILHPWKGQGKAAMEFPGHDAVWEGPELITKGLVYENLLPNASGVVFRRTALEEVGGVDPSIAYCADWLLWLKLCSFSKVARIAQPYNHFRRHPHSVIHKAYGQFTAWQADLMMRKAWQKWLKSRGLHHPLTEVYAVNRQLIRQLQTDIFQELSAHRQWGQAANLLLKAPWQPRLMLQWLRRAARSAFSFQR